MKTSPFRICCDTIRYRRGFIEVANVHHNCVNIETWEVSADWKCSLSQLSEVPNEAIVTNTVIELTADQARALAAALLATANAASTEREPDRRMSDRLRVRCDEVKYRQGFIEVVGQIHVGLINVETWQVSAGADISGLTLESDRLPDDDVIANTELELTPAQARTLTAALLAAADAVEGAL